VVHEPLPCQQGWYVPFTPRSAYPRVHNILWRVLPDERDQLPDGLREFAEPARRSSFLALLAWTDHTPRRGVDSGATGPS